MQELSVVEQPLYAFMGQADDFGLLPHAKVVKELASSSQSFIDLDVNAFPS
jgi:hypothetical protein